jgi:hypothetical protein
MIDWPAIYGELAVLYGLEDCRRYREESPDVWLVHAPGCCRAKRIRVLGGTRWEWA